MGKWGIYVPEAETPDRTGIEDASEVRVHGERAMVVHARPDSRRPGPRRPRLETTRSNGAHQKRARRVDGGIEDTRSVRPPHERGVKEKREALWMSDMPAATAEIDLEARSRRGLRLHLAMLAT